MPEELLRQLVKRVRFRHLELVLTLDRCGSLRSAADDLHVTQPALSKALAELEQAFGVLLFERGPRGLTATPQGRVVVQGASVLLTELGHVGQAAQRAGDQLREVLHLGAAPFVAQAVLGEVLSNLRAAHPELAVEVTEGRVPTLFESVLKGELDAALSSYDASSVAAPQLASLRFERLVDEPIVVIASPDHPLAGRSSVGWSELARQPWIVPREGSFLRQVIETRFVSDGAGVPTPAIVSNNPATNVALVARGLGICAIAASISRASERAHHVIRLRVRPPIDPIAVALVARDSAADHPRIARLRAAVLASRAWMNQGARRSRTQAPSSARR